MIEVLRPALRAIGGRALEGLLGLGPVPQIAFHVGDLGGSRPRQVDVSDGQVHAGAEIGVHGALAIGRHQDEGAGRGGTLGRGARVEAHTLRPHVMSEDGAQLILLDLAEIGGLAAEGRNAGGGVAGRPAGDLDRLPHVGIELFGARLVDQVHRALDQPMPVRRNRPRRAPARRRWHCRCTGHLRGWS